MKRIIKNLILSAAIGIVFVSRPLVLAENIPVPQDVPGMIAYYSQVYGANSAELLNVAKCESGLRTNVYGDGGYAFGVMQFHEQTFDLWSKQFGEELDYHSANDQIKLATWAFAQGNSYKLHWTCFKR